MKFERPQRGNPHRLTVAQHVIPVRSIERFAGSDGAVDVMRRGRQILRLRPRNSIFCAQRAWDHRAEHGYMRKVENEFQAVARRVASGGLTQLPDESMGPVSRFYSLWFHRSRAQSGGEDEEVRLATNGETLTKDQEEVLESKWALFLRGKRIPARQMTGLRIQMLIDRDQLAFPERRWAVIRALEGEVLVPDVPSHPVLPITPSIMLVADQPDGLITRANLDEINAKLFAYARAYVFARDVKEALASVSDAAIARELAEREQKAALGLLL